MISIREFITQVQGSRDSGKLSEPLDWNAIFKRSGYVSVEVSPRNKGTWNWCDEQFGREHFAWTGSKFWFESEKDAIMFALRWSRAN